MDYCKDSFYYKGDPKDGYKSYVFTHYLSADEIVQILNFIERNVRLKLNIPFSISASAIQYEHTIGQTPGELPQNILKTTILRFNLCALY